MNAHTKGPWQVSGVRNKWREAHSNQMLDSHLVGPDGDAVALVFYAPEWHAEQLANARLIAAAPDLEDFARNVAGLDEEFLNSASATALAGLVREYRDEARRVLAKAEGRTP